MKRSVCTESSISADMVWISIGGKRRSRFLDNLAKRSGHGLGVGIGAHFIDSGRIFPHGIGDRSVDTGVGLLAQIVVFGVRGDTYDNHLGGIAGIGIADALADGIGVREEAAREGRGFDGGAESGRGG